MRGVLASIPSPSTGVYHVGPLTIHMYGLMLLLGIAACIWLTGRRWVKWGGDWDLVYRVAIWGVIFGIIGARIYHLITSWNQDAAIHAHWYGPFAVWEGGLGIWGAIPFGAVAGAVVVRRSGNSVRLFMDAVAPGLILAQGIGRWGNYFNQELYGKATTLPWGLKIDATPGVLHHPTFLYEFIWDVLACIALLWIDRRFTLRRPALFALYVAFYCAFRTYEETLRVDPSHHFLGERINFWVSLVCFVGAVVFFIWWQFLRTPSEARPEVKKARPIPKGPAMSVPRGRVRQRG
ncbi:MAG: prolipoprotein diacylglyceryl transferase [Actinobacteria bacterium]|nr:prolipoprotein diacylglyceryl transferase [Actinomycetota bacterium]